MPKFVITVPEIHERTLIIEAETSEEAVEKYETSNMLDYYSFEHTDTLWSEIRIEEHADFSMKESIHSLWEEVAK